MTFSRRLYGGLDFEGKLLFEHDIFSEMSPRISDFGDGICISGGATYGVVRFFYEDLYGTDAQCAIKVIKLVEKYDAAAVIDNKEPREVAVLSSFKHQNVPTFYQAWVSAGYFEDYIEKTESFTDEEVDHDDDGIHNLLFIQMEYCTRMPKNSAAFMGAA